MNWVCTVLNDKMEEGTEEDKGYIAKQSGDEKPEVALSSQCSVCSAPAADHLHYGAVSCYSCRSVDTRVCYSRGSTVQSKTTKQMSCFRFCH